MIETGRTSTTAGPCCGQLNQAFTNFDEFTLEFDTVTFGESEIGHDLGIGNLEDVHFEDQLGMTFILRDNSDLNRETHACTKSTIDSLDCRQFVLVCNPYERIID
jgi:hypothetical protein